MLEQYVPGTEPEAAYEEGLKVMLNQVLSFVCNESDFRLTDLNLKISLQLRI